MNILPIRLRNLIAILIALSGLSAQAGVNTYSIGVHFGADEPNGGNTSGLAPADVAGLPAVAQANWNIFSGAAGVTNGTLVANSNGVALPTTVGLIWASPNTWASYGRGGEVNGANFLTASAPDHAMMQGYLDTAGAGTTTVTFTNLPSQLTSQGYDVYIYSLNSVANRGGSFRIVDGLNNNTVLTPYKIYKSDTAPTNYVQDPGTSTAQTGNYVLFRGLTNANITIQATTTVNPQGDLARAPVQGVQLVQGIAPGESGPATALTVATNQGSGKLLLSWTPGAGSSGSLVVMRSGLPTTAVPVDGVTYTGDATFGNGTNLGDDENGLGNFAVYSGSGSSVVVSNLLGGVPYSMAVYAYNGSGGSINYTLGSVPVAATNGAGVVTNITLNIPSTVVLGSARRFWVGAAYDTGNQVDVTPVATTTSSNTAIVSIQSVGRLAAQALGSVGMKSVYQGFTNIQIVTVSSMAMTYQWSFNDEVGSLVVTDSVVNAIGTVSNLDLGTGPTGSGQLSLGGSGGFVLLPPNIISNYGALTVETWATEFSTPNNITWTRVWDFGQDTIHNMFFSPNAGGGFLRAAWTTNGGGAETQVNFLFQPSTVLHHYVLTVAGASRVGKLFVDGVQVGVNNNFIFVPEDIGPTANDYLGKSQYAADPSLNGTMDEFRIYNGALDALQIAVDAATGPDLITSNPGALTNLTVTAASPMTQFNVEQATVLGGFANVANPVNLTTVPQTKYSSSNTNVVFVDALGVVTATGPGTALVIATNTLGQSSSTSVTVIALPPGLTHRYNMNNDANDSIGGSHGTPHGSLGFDGTAAVFDGAGGTSAAAGASYIELPPNLLLGYSSVAIELWYTDSPGQNGWSRIFDFGAGTASYMFLTPLVGAGPPAFPYNMRTAFLLAGQTGGEEQINIPRPSTNVEHHAVWVIDASTLKGRIYIDGQLQLERNGARQPRDMGATPNDWLGRSQFGGDGLFIGRINELRLYNGILTPLQVYIDYLAGPDVVTNGGTVSTVTMSLTNMPAQSKQQARLLANFSAFPNVPLMSGSSNWVSSDLTVALVDSDGLITSLKAGTANISATFNGTTASALLTVSAAPPVLAHRYSFDSDATDSVGGANGVNAGATIFTGGTALMDGTANSYITLPGHLLDGLKEVTLETWLTFSNANVGNARVWDFGNSAITNYLYFTPISAANTLVRYAYDLNPGNGALVELNLVKTARGNSGGTNTIHYVWVFSDILGKADLYMDGVLQDTFPYSWILQPPTLSRLSNVESYLGHASRTNAPPANNLMGAINEFRIWNGALNKVQVAASYAAGPTNVVIDPGAPSTLTLTLNDPTMVLGTIQRPTVKGTFAGLGTLDLTAVSGVVFTSSDSTKVQVIGGGEARLQAVGVGAAQIVASYGGKTATNNVTVIAAPALRVAHRYSFRGTPADSVGQADAKLWGEAAFVTNAVVLTGASTPNTYVQLPSDIISGYDKLTIEAFATVGAINGGFARLWDFGTRISAAGFNYLYYAPGVSRLGIPGAQGEVDLNSAQLGGIKMHAVATIDSAAGIMTLYTNGVSAGAVTNRGINLSLVNSVYSQLGRSQFGDPFLPGAIDEFRLYSGVMSASQIAASFAAGPDPEKLTVSVGPGTVTLAWPAVPVLDGYSLQSAPSLSPPIAWSAAGAPTVVNGTNFVTLPQGGATSFFRLVR